MAVLLLPRVLLIYIWMIRIIEAQTAGITDFCCIIPDLIVSIISEQSADIFFHIF